NKRRASDFVYPNDSYQLKSSTYRLPLLTDSIVSPPFPKGINVVALGANVVFVISAKFLRYLNKKPTSLAVSFKKCTLKLIVSNTSFKSAMRASNLSTDKQLTSVCLILCLVSMSSTVPTVHFEPLSAFCAITSNTSSVALIITFLSASSKYAISAVIFVVRDDFCCS